MKSIETNEKQRIKVLRGNEYFDDLPETMLKDIAAHMHLREYQRGDVLFWEGDPCDGLFIVDQGSAKIFRLSPQGRQYIVRILQEGDTFAEVPAFDEGTNPSQCGGAGNLTFLGDQQSKITRTGDGASDFRAKGAGELWQNAARHGADGQRDGVLPGDAPPRPPDCGNAAGQIRAALDAGTTRGKAGNRTGGGGAFHEGTGALWGDQSGGQAHPHC
jgi:hypothetical protein